MPHKSSRPKLNSAVIGIDVGKASLVLHDGLTGRTLAIANDAEAIMEALAPYAAYDRAVCEATGGYERLVLAIAHELGLAIHRAHPSQVKAYVRSHREQAKTDAIDAYWLARFAAERGDTLVDYGPADEDHEALTALVRYRQQAVARRTAQTNRLKGPAGDAAKPFIAQELAFLKDQIAKIDREISSLIGQSERLRRAEAKLRDIPGIGAVAACVLIALIPELGTMNRRQAAAIAGLAPHPKQSGIRMRAINRTKGREGIKPALFMAAMSAARHDPTLRHFYQNLLDNGKAKKVALGAVARKLIVRANSQLKLI